MSQFAVLDENNFVIDIIVADDLKTAKEATGKNCVVCDPALGITGNYGFHSYDPTSKTFVDHRISEVTE